MVLAACGVEAGSKALGPAPQDGVIGSDVGPGSAGTSTTEATTTTIPPTKQTIEGTDGNPTNDIIGNAVTDLEAFWADAYPEAYLGAYRPLSGGLHAIDRSTDPRTVPCAQGVRDIGDLLDNAFYCPDDDAVVWDQQGFMPAIADKYGSFTAAVVIAHEWGHAIQERAGFRAPAVVTELQADCFAGAWTKHVADGDSTLFTVSTDQLDTSLAGILSLRDAAGSTADDPFAHGSGFDRVGAFQDGFEKGVTRCAAYRTGDPEPFQWEFSASEIANQGDLPLSGPGADDDIVDLVFPSLDRYWKKTFPTVSGGSSWDPMGDPRPFTAGNPPTCDGKAVTDYSLFVCTPDRYVGFDITRTMPAAYEASGDFGVATLFATQYGLDVVDQLGSARSALAATLQGDCFAGAWAGNRLPGADDTQLPDDAKELTLSPGDLDEGVSVLLSFRSASDRARQGPGFDRVKAFRRGVLQGADACTAITGS